MSPKVHARYRKLDKCNMALTRKKKKRGARKRNQIQAGRNVVSAGLKVALFKKEIMNKFLKKMKIINSLSVFCLMFLLHIYN